MASSPQGYQSTGLCWCNRRYGLLSPARRLVVPVACALMRRSPCGTHSFIWWGATRAGSLAGLYRQKICPQEVTMPGGICGEIRGGDEVVCEDLKPGYPAAVP